jgi:hypothetical protein
VVESVAVPVHVPVSEALPGEVGALELPPHAATSKPNSVTIDSELRIFSTFPCLRRFTIVCHGYANRPPGEILDA